MRLSCDICRESFKTVKIWYFLSNKMREKCLNTEFFLVYIFLYLDWIQENTDQKFRIWTIFMQW